MKIYENIFPFDAFMLPDASWNFYPFNTYELNEICYFDIETTGLSADTSNVYLIGLGYYANDHFHVKQWFADDYNSEKQMIKEFLEDISSFKIIMHYNGATFDIPYINKKCKRHKINPAPLNEIKSLDMYTTLRKYAPVLGLPNKKLKSFEKYVGLYRDDAFNGGELIEVYAEYMQRKYINGGDEMLLHTLLLHNYEDITGMSSVASLLFLRKLSSLDVIFENASVIREGQNEYINAEYSCALSGNYNFEFNINDIQVKYSNNKVFIQIQIISTTLKYFFDDYKDYYYMINEDTVMHKSVAVYTDASVRRKAKKAECFVTKGSSFIPVQKSGCFSEKYHVFKTELNSKEFFVEMKPELLENKEFFTEYYRQCVI